MLTSRALRPIPISSLAGTEAASRLGETPRAGRCGRVATASRVHEIVWRKRIVRTLAASAGGSGGGLLERPTTTPGRESEFDLGKQNKTQQPKDYRVMLHNDNYNKREYVVQTLMKVIPGMTVDIAVNIMQEAHMNNMAVVIQCPQEDAEEYCDKLRGSGLISSIEPCGNGKGGGEGTPDE